MEDSDRSIASVLSDIVGNVQEIVRAEVRLAKTEVREEIGKARRGLMFVAAGATAAVLAACSSSSRPSTRSRSSGRCGPPRWSSVWERV